MERPAVDDVKFWGNDLFCGTSSAVSRKGYEFIKSLEPAAAIWILFVTQSQRLDKLDN